MSPRADKVVLRGGVHIGEPRCSRPRPRAQVEALRPRSHGNRPAIVATWCVRILEGLRVEKHLCNETFDDLLAYTMSIRGKSCTRAKLHAWC